MEMYKWRCSDSFRRKQNSHAHTFRLISFSIFHFTICLLSKQINDRFIVYDWKRWADHWTPLLKMFNAADA